MCFAFVYLGRPPATALQRGSSSRISCGADGATSEEIENHPVCVGPSRGDVSCEARGRGAGSTVLRVTIDRKIGRIFS